jgi:hypothetical protein
MDSKRAEKSGGSIDIEPAWTVLEAHEKSSNIRESTRAAERRSASDSQSEPMLLGPVCMRGPIIPAFFPSSDASRPTHKVDRVADRVEARKRLEPSNLSKLKPFFNFLSLSTAIHVSTGSGRQEFS